MYCTMIRENAWSKSHRFINIRAVHFNSKKHETKKTFAHQKHKIINKFFTVDMRKFFSKYSLLKNKCAITNTNSGKIYS